MPKLNAYGAASIPFQLYRGPVLEAWHVVHPGLLLPAAVCDILSFIHFCLDISHSCSDSWHTATECIQSFPACFALCCSWEPPRQCGIVCVGCHLSPDCKDWRCTGNSSYTLSADLLCIRHRCRVKIAYPHVQMVMCVCYYYLLLCTRTPQVVSVCCVGPGLTLPCIGNCMSHCFLHYASIYMT